MQYSPKLKMVMEQILSILKENDITGMVTLHTIEGEGHVDEEGVQISGVSENLLHINTSYSAAMSDGDKLLLRAKVSDYESRDKRDIAMAASVNMTTHFQRSLNVFSEQVGIIEKAFSRMVTKIDNDDFGEASSHVAQNN